MKPADSHDPLLDALLTDRTALDAMRSAGLAELRRRRWRRMARLMTAGAAAAVVVLAATRSWKSASTPISEPVRDAHADTVAVVSDAPRPTPPELTDDELVDQFPPGTCTIAEIDGRKMLVFLTAEAQAKYLR